MDKLKGKKNQSRRSAKIEGIIMEEYDKEDPVATVKDVLTDLRHFCDVHRLSFHEAFESSYQHYLAEKNGEDKT